MLIAGFEKNTLVDYPGKIASIIFTYGCNLQCGYCHNPELVTLPCKKETIINEEEVISYLRKRSGLIEGLVITGGEPTLQPDLIEFIKKVKEIGVLVKLDTNGLLTKKIQGILEENIVDYWAMDVKYPSQYYQEYGIDIDAVKNSIELIKKSAKDYEFRTTFVKGVHKLKDVNKIGELIKGSKRYYIQNFRKGKTIDPELDSTNSFTDSELKEIKKTLIKYVKNIHIR